MTSAEVIFDDHDDDNVIVLYQHADGYEIANTVARALDAHIDRWNDTPYLARCVFQTMIGDDKSSTGWGIATATSYPNYEVRLDVGQQMVWYRIDNNTHAFTFQQFIESYI